MFHCISLLTEFLQEHAVGHLPLCGRLLNTITIVSNHTNLTIYISHVRTQTNKDLSSPSLSMTRHPHRRSVAPKNDETSSFFQLLLVLRYSVWICTHCQKLLQMLGWNNNPLGPFHLKTKQNLRGGEGYLVWGENADSLTSPANRC
jgi:hypothetical protein